MFVLAILEKDAFSSGKVVTVEKYFAFYRSAVIRIAFLAFLIFSSNCSYWSEANSQNRNSQNRTPSLNSATTVIQSGNTNTVNSKKKLRSIGVADLKLSSNMSNDLKPLLTNVIISEISKYPEIQIVDRANMKILLSAQGVQLSNCDNESCFIQTGKIIGLSDILIGSIITISDKYYINLQIISVKTALLEAVSEKMVSCSSDELLYHVRECTNTLINQIIAKQTGG